MSQPIDSPKTQWKSLYAEPPASGTYFTAIWADGSGAGNYIAIDADDFGPVVYMNLEDHEIEDPESVLLDGAVWTEAPEEIVKPFFLRGQ